MRLEDQVVSLELSKKLKGLTMKKCSKLSILFIGWLLSSLFKPIANWLNEDDI